MPLRELSTMFSYRFLFGPTMVPYFPRNKGFIYFLHFYVSVYSCLSPRLFFVCLGFSYWFLLSISCLFIHFPDIFQSGFWDFDQDALLDGPI